MSKIFLSQNQICSRELLEMAEIENGALEKDVLKVGKKRGNESPMGNKSPLGNEIYWLLW
jgi:hypothetical protein